MDPFLLLDTNIVSYAFKGDDRIRLYASVLADKQLAVSFMTVAELCQWAAIRKWGERRVGLLEEEFQNYIFLSVDLELCRLWGHVRAQCRARGRAISPQDAWIGATALRYQIPLVTHDPDDFAVIDDIVVISQK